MLDAFDRAAFLRNREIDPRVVQHPFGIVRLGYAGRFAKQAGIEGDRGIEVFNPDVDVKTLHDAILSAICVGAQLPPAQQFSVR